MLINTENIRLATIGCGRMGAFHSLSVEKYAPEFWMPISHLDAGMKIKGIDIVAASDISEERLNEVKKSFSIPQVYLNYHDLLRQNEIDILTIATRTPQKAEIILEALEKGVKAIHVEKPLCNSKSELLSIEQAVKEYDAFVSYGAIRRFLPPYRQAHKISSSNDFGEILDIQVEMGKSPLMWTLIHAIDLLIYFSGGSKITQIQASFENVEMLPEEKMTVHNDPYIVSCTLLFENGITGRIGRSSGEGVTVSSATSRIEVFADGKQLFHSAIPPDDIYQRKVELNVDSKADGVGVFGTGAALSLLKRALEGEKDAVFEMQESMTAMFNGQSTVFDMINSHLHKGAFVSAGDYPDEVSILGVSQGKYA